MIPSLKKARAFVPEIFARVSFRRDSGPIDSVESLSRFVSTRAAFVAQKTLYGYVKTRMGTRYPRMFEDDVFIDSINIAKMHVFAGCLSDLAIYAVERALRDREVTDARRLALALQCYRAGLADNTEQARDIEAFSAAEALAAFEWRLAFWDWQAGPRGPDIFTASPAALYRWAPIAPELKRQDREIVENSIRFAWREIRSRFKQRVDGTAIASEAEGTRRRIA